MLKVCPQCGTEYETAARFCPNDGTALRPKGSDTLIGRVLADRYHILKRIGEGGMGRVYLGEHVKMNRQCAIKVMSPALVNDAESAARFAREASNAARIIHPNVAAVFDYGESEGLIYLVMEYVDGEPLSRILAREAPLAVDRALDIARQIADGLGAAHELGIVHRDLKPDNILVTRTRSGTRGRRRSWTSASPRRCRKAPEEALTRTGLVIGTPEFMSPEQLLGDPVDARSDLYALGCILHLMLTATPPFAATTREQMIKRRLSEDAPHVQQLDPGFRIRWPASWNACSRAAPSDRYGSAAEVRDALAGTHCTHAAPVEGVARTHARHAAQRTDDAPSRRLTQAPTEVTEVAVLPTRTFTPRRVRARLAWRSPWCSSSAARSWCAARAAAATSSSRRPKARWQRRIALPATARRRRQRDDRATRSSPSRSPWHPWWWPRWTRRARSRSRWIPPRIARAHRTATRGRQPGASGRVGDRTRCAMPSAATRRPSRARRVRQAEGGLSQPHAQAAGDAGRRTYSASPTRIERQRALRHRDEDRRLGGSGLHCSLRQRIELQGPKTQRQPSPLQTSTPRCSHGTATGWQIVATLTPVALARYGFLPSRWRRSVETLSSCAAS